MTREPMFGLKEPAEDRSIIVVSDLHLGGQEDPHTAWRLCRFLEHIRKGTATVSYPCRAGEQSSTGGNPGTKTIHRPEKIILLGDIMELWDSRGRDRNRPFLDALLPLLKMRDMDTDVVYVAGNHDEDIAELIDSCDHDKKELAKERIKMRQQMESEHPGEKPLVGCSPRALGVLRSVEKDGTERPESLKVAWGESPDGDPRTFEICNRHYPGHRVDKGAEGLNVGGIDYAFVHGQQFDKEQITYSISQAIGRRVDPVDFLQDLASISVTRNMKDRIQWVNGGLAIVLLMILVKPEFLQVLPGQIFSWGVMVFGAITGFLLALMFLYGIYLFGYARCGPDRVASADILIKICVIGFVVCALLLVMGLMGLLEGVKTGVVASGILWGFFLLLLVASLYMLGVMTFPVLFAWAKRKVYNGFLNIRNMSSNAVLTEKFDATTYTFKTKVLIFGHTHQPDFTKPEKDDKFRLLINTGTWVDEHPDRETKKCDTFVYIDKNGVCCLRWNDRKRKIECFCKDMEDGPKPLCRFLEDNKILLKDPPGSSP